MRNALPASGPRYCESAVVNLDDDSDPGTHWVAYRRRGKNVDEVKYNHERYQDFDTYNCGHLCLKFLCGTI